MALIGYLNGLAWTARIGPQEIFVGVFIVSIGYAGGFHLFKTRLPWLVSALVCAIVADAIALRPILEAGLVPQRLAITSLEWFVSVSIAGVIAMLVPTGRPPDDKKSSKPLY